MPEKLNLAIGGQALIEGVMIRSPHYITMSARTPRGEIETVSNPYTPLSKRVAILGIPIVRGIINFAEMMIIGIRALNWSTKKAFEDEPTITQSKRESIAVGFSMFVSVLIVLALFKYVPFLITNYLDTNVPLIHDHWIIFNAVDGIIKISIFLIYILLISRLPDIKRVFQYHGAEHKSIFAYEHDAPMTPTGVRPYQKEHPRCGTSFILIVFTISILFYTVVPRLPEFWTNLGLRILFLPIIAGIAYEVLKLAGKYQNSAILRIISLPGMWFQYLTTQEPDDKQLEVALATITKALELEKTIPTAHA